MLKWAAIFLLIALVAGAFGFTGVAGASAGMAKILFAIFIIGALIFMALAAGLFGAFRK